MNIHIRINCDNDAFANYPSEEVARIIRNLSHEIDGAPMDPGDRIPLYDHNGNRVGEFKVTK